MAVCPSEEPDVISLLLDKVEANKGRLFREVRKKEKLKGNNKVNLSFCMAWRYSSTHS
jgi:hypothetical protein